MDFKKYFTAPYQSTEYGRILDSKGSVALHLNVKHIGHCQKITDALNGVEHESFEYEIRDDIEFWNKEGEHVMCVRSWGRLTGTGKGGLGLKDNVAEQIQDDFALWVLSVLNNETKETDISVEK